VTDWSEAFAGSGAERTGGWLGGGRPIAEESAAASKGATRIAEGVLPALGRRRFFFRLARFNLGYGVLLT
jgi:hypothetical protein